MATMYVSGFFLFATKVFKTISPPTGIFAIVLARQYEEDNDFAAQMSVVGIFLMLLVYPVLISLVIWLLVN